MREEIINIDQLQHFVPVPEEYHKKSWVITEWLFQFDEDNYMMLYHQYTPSDGQWHSGPSSVPAFVAFKNEEDAVAFKLRWV